jgi:hypothetical protein
MFTSALAQANPRPLPFTYQHEQLPEGASELEQFVDYSPIKARNASNGDPAWYSLTQFQTEFEHGITPRLELGLYVTFVPGAGVGFSDVPRAFMGNGLKQRLRYQLAPTGVWPIDISLYGEVAENEREIELEAKIILQRRFGSLRLIGNLVGEQEFYFRGEKEFVLAPSAGATLDISPTIQPSLEWWMRAEFPQGTNVASPRPFALGPHHYVGPTVLLQFRTLWWTTGAYLRLSDTHHRLEPGADGFGRIWVRSVVGLGF